MCVALFRFPQQNERFYTRRCTTNPWRSLHTSNYRFARSFRWPNSIHRVNALRFTCPATDGRARCGTFKRHSGCRRPRAVSVPATCREHAARVHPLHHGKQKMRSTLQTLLRFSSSRCGTSLPEKCNSFFFFLLLTTFNYVSHCFLLLLGFLSRAKMSPGCGWNGVHSESLGARLPGFESRLHAWGCVTLGNVLNLSVP